MGSLNPRAGLPFFISLLRRAARGFVRRRGREVKESLSRCSEATLQLSIPGGAILTGAMRTPRKFTRRGDTRPWWSRRCLEAGVTDVDPVTTEIRVTFSKEMQDGSWSWSTHR